jgi:hypothetical protein
MVAHSRLVASTGSPRLEDRPAKKAADRLRVAVRVGNSVRSQYNHHDEKTYQYQRRDQDISLAFFVHAKWPARRLCELRVAVTIKSTNPNQYNKPVGPTGTNKKTAVPLGTAVS